MNTIQKLKESNYIELERVYIYNGKGQVKYVKTVEEFKAGLSIITPDGFNAIGIEYSAPNQLPGAKDLWVKYDGEDTFSMSNAISGLSDECYKKLVNLANVINQLFHISYIA